ncbi:SseB family protein [Dactylosporangium sp. CA-139066]|uniref:SseB family protein n=1 Tax=Dactylosporangium sp. CA-139066 TaxID=3239930 RepID=UPI003D915139
MTAPDPIQPAWLPGNETEAQLVTALAGDDREAFCRIVRDALWFLPAFPDEPEGQRFLTHDLLGETYLLVFTSVQSLVGAVGALVDSYTVTGYDELAGRWPNPAWRLAVNAGTPIDAWVTLSALAEAARGERVVPTLATIAAQSDPDPADPQMDGVLDDFLAELNRADFLVPVTVGPPPRYAVARHEDGPAVEVFTSERELAARHPEGVAWTRAGLEELLAAWPGDDCALLIDPGSDAPFRVEGADVPGLLLWGPSGADRPAPEDIDGDEQVNGLTSPRIADVEYIEGQQRDGERGETRDESGGTSGLGESVFRRR